MKNRVAAVDQIERVWRKLLFEDVADLELTLEIAAVVFHSTPRHTDHVRRQVDSENVSFVVSGHDEIASADAAAHVEHFLIWFEIERLQKLCGRLNAAGWDETVAKYLLISQYAIQRVLFVVEKLLQRFEAVKVAHFDFGVQKGHLYVSIQLL